MESRIVTIDDVNQTTSNKTAIFNVSRTESFLDNPEEYSLSINRFYIPTSTISPISQNLTYTIGLGSTSFNGSNNGTDAFNEIDVSSVTNAEKFVNKINETLVHCHYDFWNLWEAIDTSNDILIKKTGTFSGDFTSSQNDQTFTISQSGWTDAKVVFLKLTLKKLQKYDTNPVSNIGFKILTPDSTSCYVLANKSADSDTNKNITILDYGENYSSDQLVNSSTIKPIELFQKLYGKSSLGDWTVSVESNSASDKFYIEFDYELIMINETANRSKNNCYSIPFFSIESTNQVVLNYSEAFIKSGFYITLNSNLSRLLKFSTRTITISTDLTTVIDIGSYLGTSNIPSQINNLKIYQDSSSSSRTLSDLYKLLIKCSLPIENTIIGLTQREDDQILTDFQTDEFDSSFYVYSVDFPNRTFKLKPGVSASNFTISVWIQRTNGEQQILTYAPNENISMLLAFYKKSSQ